jgi:CheY-like chemotaxis protein
MPNDKNRMLSAGMNGYLTKPVRKADLTRIIETWLRHEPVIDAASA